ncbi:hypothetical protein F4780DRAFT_357328 [Xylariomycetidae sp. FL0641]|nr:hypothetical protein F4780DRAFT_357328 [Xylariomycetidae sp. FL0641]
MADCASLIQRALARTSGEEATPLERMPPEIKLLIIQNVDDSRSVMNLALTGPHFCELVTQHEESIVTKILAAIEPSLVPLAKLRLEAATADWAVARRNTCRSLTNNEYSDQLNDFIGEIYERIHLQKHSVGPMTLPFAANLVSFHLTVSEFADELSSKALSRLPDRRPGVLASASVASTGELTRFKKALYIFQLVSLLLLDVEDIIVRYVSSNRRSMQINPLWETFWRSFEPWESQQVRCVQHILVECAFGAGWIEKYMMGQSPTHLLVEYKHHAFVLHKGLSELQALRSGDGCTAMRQAFDEFGFTDSHRIDAYARDAIWFRTGINIVMSRPINYHTDGTDAGPAEAWYHTLIQDKLEDPQLTQGQERIFYCGRCMAEFGFVFWDHQRLDMIAKGQMPDMPTLREIAVVDKDTFIHFLFNEGARAHQFFHHRDCQYAEESSEAIFVR